MGDVTLEDFVYLPVIGLAAGILGGLLGIGGSIVMIPAMTELLGPRPHLYQAAALIVNFFVALPAVRQHARAHALDPHFLRKLLPAAMLAAVAGVACSEFAVFRGQGALRLTGLFGAFLFYVAVRDVVRLVGDRRNNGRAEGTRPKSHGTARALMVGIPTGVVSGLLGVGGGVIAVPLLRRVYGLSMRAAVANSAAMIVGLSLVGAGAKHLALAWRHAEYELLDPAKLAVWLIPTAAIGATIGARLTHRLPARAVRVAFIVLLVIAGVRMSARAIAM